MLTGVLAAGLAALFTVAPGAHSVDLVGRRVVIPLPAGHCKVGDVPSDAALLERANVAAGSSNRVLLSFARCTDLAAFRAGKRQTVGSYGYFLAQAVTLGGRTFDGFPRAQFIEKMRPILLGPKALQKGDEHAKRLGIRYEPPRDLGDDANGLYIGILTQFNAGPGEVTKALGVTAITVVKGLSVSVNHYVVYRAAPDIPSLLASVKATTASLVASNE